jgi:flagellar motor switch protein FliG
MATATAVASASAPLALSPPSGSGAAATHGVRKAAILLTTLSAESSAAVLRLLTEEEVHDITREISALKTVGDPERTATLTEFLEKAANNGHQIGGIEYATTVLLKAFGPETGKRLADRLLRSLGADQPNLDTLRKADVQHLAKVVDREHPQTIALILCHLGATRAAELLMALPPDLRSQVAKRMAAVDQISPDILNRIAKSVSSKLRVLGESSMEAYGGVRSVAEVLNRVDAATSEAVLKEVEAEDPNLAQTIRNLMFVFEDFLNVGPEAIRIILSKIDRKILTMAMKGCRPPIKKHFTALMSARATEMFEEDMQALGPVRIKDVEEAQQIIVGIARQLQADNVISLKASAAEEFVL